MTPSKSSVLRRCEYCGKEFYVYPCVIKHGLGKFCSRSCNAKISHITHGKTESRTYRSWTMMLQRCTNPKYTGFSKYGGAGITVSKEWSESFELFLSDLGERPIGKNLDRINGKLGYFKGNCRWATPREQGENRYTSRLITFREETKCVTEWARTVGLSAPTVISRLNSSWTVEEALTIPRHNRCPITTIRKKHMYATFLQTPS
jgi:hypothetical protein